MNSAPLKPFYISILEHELAARKAQRPAYSLRALARFLDIEPSALSRILSNTQPLSVKSGIAISKKLNLAVDVRNQFLLATLQAQVDRLSRSIEKELSEPFPIQSLQLIS